MEWALNRAATAPAVRALRHELVAHLRRHADQGADIAGAEIVIAELLANAVEHSDGPVWVTLDWALAEPQMQVHDLGPGFELDPALPEPVAARGHGLFLVNAIAPDLRRAAKRAGGSKVSVTLPVRRRVQASHDPPRDVWSALPSPDEARVDGAFGKESFLRALVVELAQAVESEEGPDVAEALVARVGANIGGRMEEAYRAAEKISGRLSPQQTADLYVRLKRAIDGDFYVIEASDEKIVLGNRRCPFGAAVRHEPALCRMTSSVFGGIAARNAQRSAVALEERIAVGDPECRVTVWLGQHEPPDPLSVHRYAAVDVTEEPEPDLVEACRAAMHGKPFLYPEAVAAFMRDYLRQAEAIAPRGREPLTPRQQQIVRLIAQSLTSREIAQALCVTEKTVERHRSNILIKLGLRDRVALTRYAIRRGFIEA